MSKETAMRPTAKKDHAAWEARLGQMSDVASQWQQTMSSEPASIESGSDLAGDDAGFASLNVSSLVGYSLAAATEHLDFTLAVMRQTSTLYPTAYLTVLRTALLAASHAAWILAPDERAERQTNALELLADDLRTQLTMVKAAITPTDSARSAKEKMIETLVARQEELQPIADILKPGLQIAKCRINNTNIIESVAQSTHDEKLVVGGVNMVWRNESAAAHGARSFAIMRLHQNEIVEGESGTKYSKLQGDLVNDVGPASASATLALSFAFKMHDIRRR
jgi:hypothetical protein